MGQRSVGFWALDRLEAPFIDGRKLHVVSLTPIQLRFCELFDLLCNAPG
jgi:hypothetical protein